MLKKISNSFVPALIWALIIVVGSLLSSSKVPSIAVSDKGIHFFFYAIFAFLLYFPVYRTKKIAFSFLGTAVIIVLIGFIFGALIELVQDRYIVGRFGEWLDLVANSLGLLVGALVGIIFKRKAVL